MARTATRSGELAIRTALGASRLRLVSQLFVESLLLAVVAASLGLLAFHVVAGRLQSLSADLPFWVDLGVSLETAALAVSLAVLGFRPSFLSGHDAVRVGADAGSAADMVRRRPTLP